MTGKTYPLDISASNGVTLMVIFTSRRFLYIVTAGALLAGMLLAYSLASPPRKHYEVPLGVEFNTHSTPAWIALHENLFEQYGLNITKLFKFRTGPELAAALARGEIDYAVVCLGPVLNIIDRGVDVKIVAKIHNYGYALIVNPSNVKTVNDLNGTTIYVAGGLVAATSLLLMKVQDVYNLKFDIKPVQDPQVILSMLISGQASAAGLPEHYASVAEARGLRVLLRAQDVWPNMPGSYLVARGDVLKEKPEVVKILLEVMRKGIEYIAFNKTLAAEAAAKELGVEVNIALRSIELIEWNAFINVVNVQEIQDYVDFMYSHGLLDKRLNATEIVAPAGSG